MRVGKMDRKGQRGEKRRGRVFMTGIEIYRIYCMRLALPRLLFICLLPGLDTGTHRHLSLVIV